MKKAVVITLEDVVKKYILDKLGKGGSKAELHRLTGMSRSHIDYYLKGGAAKQARYVGIKHLDQLARQLKKKPSALLVDLMQIALQLEQDDELGFIDAKLDMEQAAKLLARKRGRPRKQQSRPDEAETQPDKPKHR